MTTPDAADFYTGIVADAYAELRSNTYDAELYAAFVRDVGEPALEIGCGDGDPILALRQQGFDVEGVDSSQDMLERCQHRAAAAGTRVVTHHQRMEELDLSRRFRAIYLAGPTFNLLPDDRTARRALEAIRAHLLPDGAALIPLWIPPPTPPEELGAVRSARTSDGAIARFVALSEEYDKLSRVRRTHTRYELEQAGGTEVVEREWVIHWHTEQSFGQLAAAAGLDAVRVPDDRSDMSAFTFRLRPKRPARRADTA